MKTPWFLEKGMMFNPHSRLKSIRTAVPFPDLHSATSQLASQGHELQDMPAAAGKRRNLWEMGGSQVCALGPRTAQLCRLRAGATDHPEVGGPVYTRAPHTRSRMAFCQV